MYKMEAETAEHMEFIQQISGMYMVDIQSAIAVFEWIYYENNPLQLISFIKDVRRERNKSQRFMNAELRSKGIGTVNEDVTFDASFEFMQHFELRCKYNLTFAILVETLNEFGVNADLVINDEGMWNFGENNNFDAFEGMDILELPNGKVIALATPEDMEKMRNPKKKNLNKKVRKKKGQSKKKTRRKR